MKNFQHRANLEKQRRIVAQKIKAVAAMLQQLKLPTVVPGIYDNRHPEAVYKKLEQRAAQLQKRKNLTAPEQEELLNQLLGLPYYQNFYADFHEVRAAAPPKIEHAREEPFRGLFHAIARGLHCFKVKNSPDAALECLRLARRKSCGWSILENGRLRGSKAEIYDYMAMILEGGGVRGEARKYLDWSIGEGEPNNNNPDLQKYQYIKRALLQVQDKQFLAALTDLAHALTIRPVMYVDTSIFWLDEVIYWEQAKIFKALKDYSAAAACVAQVIHLSQLNRKNSAAGPGAVLLRTLKKYQAQLAAEKPVSPLQIYHAAAARAERRENYDSFQVNSKCPVYLKFIASIHEKPEKSFRDWEYLAAYKFSRHIDKRSYESSVPSNRVAPEGDVSGIDKRGLQYLYLERNYEAAAEVFSAALKKQRHNQLYELCARAQIASGNYKAAVATLTNVISPRTPPAKFDLNNMFENNTQKFCRLMRGVAWSKINHPQAAREDFTAGLAYPVAPGRSYPKVHNMLLWERAKLARTQGETALAVADLKLITGNSACRACLDFVGRK